LVPGMLAEVSDEAVEFTAAVDSAFRAAEADRAVLEHASNVRDEASATGRASDSFVFAGAGIAEGEAAPEPQWMHPERVARARDAA